MDKQIQKLKDCMKEKCKVEQSSVTILSDMEAVLKRITSLNKVTEEDVSEMRRISEKVRQTKVDAKKIKCMVDKCMTEYAALTEANLQNVGEKLDKAAALMETMLAQASKNEKQKTRTNKTSSKKKS